MNKVALKGSPVSLRGRLPAIGKRAKDFRLTKGDLSDVGLSAFAGKVKLLNLVPSLDTSTCALSAKRFEKEAGALGGLAVLTISRDLPFAQDRFCKGEGIKNVTFLSALRSPGFAKAWGLDIADGPLEGLIARAVVVLDKSDVVRYVQLVPEISQEPDYDAALKAVKALL